MIRLFHVSDIHFGAEDRAALDWFTRAVHDERPDAVIMTGDLTMRARSHEFEAASAWLKALDCPVTVEVGNHDLPYFNPLARLLHPYRRYHAVERAVERPLQIPGVAVVPLRTTARFQLRLNWSKGNVSGRQLSKTLAQVRQRTGDGMMLVAAHHPLVDTGTRSTSRTHGGREALRKLATAGVDAVLSGHVHDPFDVEHRVGGRTIRLIGAGTLSERTRDYRPSFNALTIQDGALSVSPRIMV